MSYTRLKNGLIVPKGFNDEKEFLKENLNKIIQDTIQDNQDIKGRYFIEFHGKFDKMSGDALRMCSTVIRDLPIFITNQIVIYVDNAKGLAEWLWSVTPQKQIQFNTEGVAYLQAKGAMPSRADSRA